MSINWERVLRGQPTPKDIKAAVKVAKQLPDAGDPDHVSALFKVHDKPLPAIDATAWQSAKLDTVKLKKLHVSNGQLERANLVWHIQHFPAARDSSGTNSHIQVVRTGGDLVVVGGHHRSAAAKLLGQPTIAAWVVKAKNLDSDGKPK